ncbi:hypothetical protein BH11PSE12_BH11PSE12_12300 [soil metagenome]
MTQPDTRAHPQTASGAASVTPDTALHQPIDQPISPPMLPPNRAQLRKYLLGLRRTTDSALRREWDALLGQHLLAWCQQHQPASLGLFWPIQAEPDLRGVYPLLHQMGIVLALPVVLNKAQPLVFLQWQPGDAMAADEHGVPAPAQRAHRLQPEVILVPCVGFNCRQFRLGYGGGYYDRSLAQSPRPRAIGIAYQQALADFPAESHDIAMDLMLTEQAS